MQPLGKCLTNKRVTSLFHQFTPGKTIMPLRRNGATGSEREREDFRRNKKPNPKHWPLLHIELKGYRWHDSQCPSYRPMSFCRKRLHWTHERRNWTLFYQWKKIALFNEFRLLSPEKKESSSVRVCRYHVEAMVQGFTVGKQHIGEMVWITFCWGQSVKWKVLCITSFKIIEEHIHWQWHLSTRQCTLRKRIIQERFQKHESDITA